MTEKGEKKVDEWRYLKSRRQDLVHIFLFLLLIVVFHVLLVQVGKYKSRGAALSYNPTFVDESTNIKLLTCAADQQRVHSEPANCVEEGGGEEGLPAF